MKEELLTELVQQMTSYAGLDRDFADQFYEKLSLYPEVHDEFCTYLETGYLECRVKVEGYSVIDILVWQIDHFKAHLDRDKKGTRDNSHQMVLRAFDTLMNMKKEPEAYVQKLQSETGTDYEGKFW